MSHTQTPLEIVIGFTPEEVPAFYACMNSILNNTQSVCRFTPLYLPSLTNAGLYWRKDKGATDFSFSRFLAPYLAGYRGKVLFLDCDMIVKGDVQELFDALPLDKCVAVVKHDFTPKDGVKFGGLAKTNAYPKKLWSAVMVFNCSSQRVKSLTPKYVNEASGADLHQFAWTHEHRIVELPEAWQWIPNHSALPIEDAKLIHYTEEAPWWPNYPDKGSKEERIWLEEQTKLISKQALR